MKLFTHPVPVALGLTTLLTLPLVGPLISVQHTEIYHLHGNASAVFLPVFLFILLLWIAFAVVLQLTRTRPGLHFILWALILFLLPSTALKIWSTLLSLQLPHWISLLVFLCAFAGFFVLLFCQNSALRNAFHRVQQLLATMLGFASLTGILILCQLGWFAFQARHLNDPVRFHASGLHGTSSSTSARPHRIIWLLLDELSYQQLYERRPPDLELLAFDRLAQQSTLFTHTVPAGLMTEYVIPSLFTGLPVDAMRSSPDGRTILLQVLESDAPYITHWQQVDPADTVFHDALQHRYSTAIAGWYNPYCRVFASVLDRCLWAQRSLLVGDMSEDNSLTRNLLMPLHHVLDIALRSLPTQRQAAAANARDAAIHLQDYTELVRDADSLVNDPSADLLYLHMPVPHPVGIYNRHTRQFTTGPATYLDNLALADAYLAHLRQQLEQSSQWDSTTLLIMGDHSWRTVPIWTGTSAWSPEEQAASHGGQFDDRPAYIVKLPNQHTPARIEAPYAARNTRALLNALMDQRIHTPQDLANWAATQPHE